MTRDEKIFTALGLGAIFLIGRQMFKKNPEAQTFPPPGTPTGVRGVRNNNPGNIRHSSSPWQGMRAQQTDPAFVQFTDMPHGIRAMYKIFNSYRGRGLRTIEDIIHTWAPYGDGNNNPDRYTEFVVNELNRMPYSGGNFTKDTQISANFPEYSSLAYAMSKMELGASNVPHEQHFYDAWNIL